MCVLFWFGYTFGMRLLAATLAVVVALMFSAGSAWADIDDSLAAAQRGDFVTALQEWRPLAEQGHAKAQNNLGVMYLRGTGVPANAAKAYMWISLSNAQGYKNAAQFMDLIKLLITPAQIAEGKALAAEWREKYNN